MRAHLAAVGVAVGALLGVDVDPLLAAPAAGIALLGACRGRAGLVVMVAAAVVVAAAAATHARAGLDLPPPGRFDAWVVAVDDPRPSGPVGVRVTVRAGGRRLTATAHGPAAGRLDDVLAGEQVHLVGTLRPVSRHDRRTLARRVVGRVTVQEVRGPVPAAPVGRLANTIRRALERGAVSLDRTQRSLLLGMVIGDDREQPPVTADDFRAAGLGHLLVVSGQNVAFVLAVATPVVGRLRPGARALALVAVLALFATVTRFEPSVLRATAMAGVGIGSAALGRPLDGRVGLSAAIAGLLLFDPFLVHQLAFVLSAAATAGIVWGAAPLAARLRGPRWITLPAATTAAAQLGVAPVLLATFGPLPLASLPANLVAGPASGVVMVWGCTGGLLAGLVGGTAATVLHLPTRGLLWWVAEVGHLAAVAPPAMLGPVSVAVIGVAALGAVAGRLPGAAGALAVASVVATSAFTAPRAGPGVHELGRGVTVWVGAGAPVVVLDDPPPGRVVLERLRRAGVPAPGLVVALDGDRADAEAVLALRDRFGPSAVVAPPLHRVPGAHGVAVGDTITVAGLEARVVAVDPRLDVSVLPARGPPGGEWER